MQRALFGDRFRVPKMGVSLCLLLALGWAHAQFSIERPQGYRAYLQAPADHEGARVLLPLWEVTSIHDESNFAVSKSVVGVPIVGDGRGLSVGDTVTLIGHFRASDQAVLLEKRVDHPLRKAKGGLSILALLVAAFCAPRFFGWSSGRVVLRG